MGNFLGAKHKLGFKPQTTPGSAEATATVWLLTESLQMVADPAPIERKTFAGSGRTLPPRKGTISPKGTTKFELSASQPEPFYWILGAVSSAAVSGASGCYEHTITDAGDGVLLTAIGDRVFDKARQGDIKLSTLKVSASPGEIAVCEMEWLALSHEDGFTYETSGAVFPTDPLTTLAATVKIDGSQDFTIDQVEFTIDTASTQVPVLEAAEGAPKMVRRTGPMKVMGKMRFIDFPAAELAKLREATEFALELNLVGDVITGTTRKGVKTTLHACAYTGGLDPDIGAELITGEADFAGFYSVDDSAQVTVVVTNNRATIT